MYNSTGAVGVTTGSGLAATGFAVGYYILAAFALIAAGSALLRILPRKLETGVVGVEPRAGRWARGGDNLPQHRTHRSND